MMDPEIVALGEYAAGVFSNDDALAQSLEVGLEDLGFL